MGLLSKSLLYKKDKMHMPFLFNFYFYTTERFRAVKTSTSHRSYVCGDRLSHPTLNLPETLMRVHFFPSFLHNYKSTFKFQKVTPSVTS